MIISEQPLFPDNGSDMQWTFELRLLCHTEWEPSGRIRSEQNSVQLFSDFKLVLLFYSNIYVMLYLQPNDYTTLTLIWHTRFWTSCDHKTRSQFKTRSKRTGVFLLSLYLERTKWSWIPSLTQSISKPFTYSVYHLCLLCPVFLSTVPLTSHNKVKLVVSFENSSRSPFLLPRLCDHSSCKNVEKWLTFVTASTCTFFLWLCLYQPAQQQYSSRGQGVNVFNFLPRPS